jgi:hypothetical protein
VNRMRRWLALSLAVAAAALALTACSASVGTDDESDGPSADGGTTTSTKTYTNEQYGFSITYADRFTQGEPAEGSGAGGSSVLDVAFADKDGPVIADRYVNAVQTAVYELTRELKPSEVKGVKSELQGIVDQLMSSLPSGVVVEELSPVEVNGVPGFAFKYTYEEEGQELTAVTFFLFKGKYEYQITAQAVSADWESLKGDLESAVQTFTAQ